MLNFRSEEKFRLLIYGGGNRSIDCRIPKTNIEYWQSKIYNNKTRDESVAGALIQQGWSLFFIWECEIKSDKNLSRKILEFLDCPSLNS